MSDPSLSANPGFYSPPPTATASAATEASKAASQWNTPVAGQTIAAAPTPAGMMVTNQIVFHLLFQ